MAEYFPAVFGGDAFNCPYCNVYSKHEWLPLRGTRVGITPDLITNMHVSVCLCCSEEAYW